MGMEPGIPAGRIEIVDDGKIVICEDNLVIRSILDRRIGLALHLLGKDLRSRNQKQA